MRSEIPARELTDDPLLAGRLTCRQHRHGYRFSVAAVLLAHFCTPQPAEAVLDLGCGCGVISLLLAYRHPDLRLTGLELQPQLAALARSNVAANRLTARIAIVEGDLRTLAGVFAPGQFGRLVCNPPFYPRAAARLSVDAERRLARQQVTADLAAVARAAAWLLPEGGVIDLVYPAGRLAELLAELGRAGLAPARLRMVHGYPGAAAKLVLVEAVKGGGGEPETLVPLYICQEKGGEYSPEMARCYAP